MSRLSTHSTVTLSSFSRWKAFNSEKYQGFEELRIGTFPPWSFHYIPHSVTIHARDRAGCLSTFLLIIYIFCSVEDHTQGSAHASALHRRMLLAITQVHWIIQLSKSRFRKLEARLSTWKSSCLLRVHIYFPLAGCQAIFRPDFYVTLDKSCDLSGFQLPQPKPRQ